MRGTSRLQIPRTVIADMLATVARSVKSHTSFLLQQTEVGGIVFNYHPGYWSEPGDSF